MAKARAFLRNAPIKEALIDLRTREHRDLEMHQLERIRSRLEPDYVKKGPIVELRTDITVSKEGRSVGETKSRELGIRLHSRDEKYVAQFSREGFTFSRLVPYETWGKLVEEAQRLWAVYVECVHPEAVNRVAARFINNLQLPMQPGEHFEEYLTTPPQVPAALPQHVLEFLQRIMIHDTNTGLRAIVTQLLQGGVWNDRVPVILDIDVFCQFELAPEAPDVWSYLEKMRDFKNRVFFESLTEKAVELYI
jgi:uncharacterized protein (TIGR04255 family)